MMIQDSSEDSVMVNFRLPKTDLEKFDRVAVANRMSRTALLRGGVLRTIEEYESKQGA